MNLGAMLTYAVIAAVSIVVILIASHDGNKGRLRDKRRAMVDEAAIESILHSEKSDVEKASLLNNLVEDSIRDMDASLSMLLDHIECETENVKKNAMVLAVWKWQEFKVVYSRLFLSNELLPFLNTDFAGILKGRREDRQMVRALTERCLDNVVRLHWYLEAIGKFENLEDSRAWPIKTEISLVDFMCKNPRP